MSTKPPKEFENFLLQCDKDGIEPLSVLKKRAHESIDKAFTEMENKYRKGREGKTWADLAGEVYDDVKDGLGDLAEEAADLYYGNP